ncbi:MAG: energy transducer TonB, partial [Fulvivirga sp.]|nr:energy transducer TonB [Fulvivirga sp.]
KIGVIIRTNGSMASMMAEDENQVFTVVEQPATPEGGMQAYYERIASYLKYPKEAQENSIEGRVFIQFVVDEDGELTDLKVAKGIGYGTGQAAMSAILQAGKWSPASHEGALVKQRIILPVLFKLDDEQPSSVEGK